MNINHVMSVYFCMNVTFEPPLARMAFNQCRIAKCISICTNKSEQCGAHLNASRINFQLPHPNSTPVSIQHSFSTGQQRLSTSRAVFGLQTCAKHEDLAHAFSLTSYPALNLGPSPVVAYRSLMAQVFRVHRRG